MGRKRASAVVDRDALRRELMVLRMEGKVARGAG